ncbi:MAG: 6-phosphofructokinase [bacterium]
MKRIGVITSGGDAPGMNAAVRAVVRTAISQGVSVVGFITGYQGMIDNEYIEMESSTVSGIINRGGTILRSARSQDFRNPEGRQKAAETLRTLGVEGLVVIGGDGSLTGAMVFMKETGIPVMGAPGTIDNDLAGTDCTIGFDTSVNTALEAIDKVRDTAYSHDRIFVIEVMGRTKGFIALEVALAGGAEVVIVPEIPFSMEQVCEVLREGKKRGKRSSIVIVAEGAARAVDVAEAISSQTGSDAKYLVVGHMQRGGSPTSFDRVLATRLGTHATELLLAGHSGEMAGIVTEKLVSDPIPIILASEKFLNPDKIRLVNIMGL